MDESGVVVGRGKKFKAFVLLLVMFITFLLIVGNNYLMTMNPVDDDLSFVERLFGGGGGSVSATSCAFGCPDQSLNVGDNVSFGSVYAVYLFGLLDASYVQNVPDAWTTDTDTWNSSAQMLAATSVYNDSVIVAARALPGACAAGTVVQNTTTSGVQCVAVGGVYTATAPGIVLTASAFSLNASYTDSLYAKLSGIDASNLTAGTILFARLPVLSNAYTFSATNITAGTFSQDIAVSANLTVADNQKFYLGTDKDVYIMYNATGGYGELG